MNTPNSPLQQPQPGPNGVRSYGLVRGKDGFPRVDDLSLMPKREWDKLSEADQQHLLAIHGEYTPKFA
jgi:hypothetical protein